jgi:chitodextrinase
VHLDTTSGQAQNLGDTVNGIPTLHSIHVDADLGPAQAKMDSFITKHWTAIISTNVAGSGTTGGGGTTKRLASGGPVRGPGTSTSDSIPALLSNDEHVITAREVQAAGGHDAVMAWRKSLVQGFADGGPVSKDWAKVFVDADMSGADASIVAAQRSVGASMVAAASGGSGGAARWSNLVLQALAMEGQPASLLSTVLRRMNQESGGNPRAINLTDINAKRGVPSKGLMQVIDPTFRAYHDPRTSWDIYEPLANVLASMRYALARYGSLSAAYNRKGGYATGTSYVPETGDYQLHKSEAVLNPREAEAYRAGIRSRETSGGAATTAGGDRLLVFGATVRNSSEWSPPTDFTEQFDPPGDEVLIATKAQAAAGATGPLTASSSSSASHTATLLAVVPVSVSSDTTAPSAPSNLVATATGPSTIALTWDPATDNVAVAGYTVSRGGTAVATGITTTSYGDSGLSAATAYSYTVTAQDAAGNSSAASNTASATTGAAVPASLTVTPTPEPGATPPRMRLNVADTRTTPASLVTVLRINPDGTTAPVRTPDGGPLALTVSGTSRTGLLYDYEAPYGVAVSYTTAEASGTVSAAVTVDAAQVWLVHPGLPSVSMPLELLVGSLDEETWDVQQGIFWPMGREFPIVHTDGRRKAPAGSVTAQITSVEELRYLRALTADTSTLLLNVPAYLDFGVDTRYIAVGPVKVRRPSSIGSDPLRAVDLPFQVVDRPVGGTQAQRTLASFTVYPTLAALSAAYPDLAALAVGP